MFDADEADFQRAAQALDDGRNMNEILALIENPTSRGAPIGNKNSHGKRKVSITDKLLKLWVEANEDEQEEFLAEVGARKISRR